MKLIVDIPEDVYTRLFDNGIQDNEIATDDICEMARALRLGTPATYYLRKRVANTPTIIEADKAESDEQERVDDYRDILDELEREEYYESKYGKEQE